MDGAEPQTAPELRRETVGMLGAVTLGVVMLSPAMTLYGNFGPAYLAAGNAAPWAFVAALVATLPTAISYALLSRNFPSSGSAASWITRATHSDRLGEWASWIVFLYYFNNFVIQPVTLGVFLKDLVGMGGFPTGLGTFIAGTILCCAWPAWIAYRGIAISAKGALRFLLFESAVVAALCATAWFHGHRAPPIAPPPGFAREGIAGAMVFAMLAFCGFDVISTLSEEAKMARRLIPQATFWALLVFGFFIIVGVWTLSTGTDPVRLKAVADAGGMPISEIARVNWGWGAFLIPLTAISAALGIAIAAAVGASRVLFSMSRDGLAPAALSALHPRYRVPWRAMHFIFGGGLLASIATAIFLGPYQSYVWWGTTSTYFAMLTYLMVNAASLILHRKEALRSAGGFFGFAVIPAAGIALDGYILFKSFFVVQWLEPGIMGRGVIYFNLVCTLGALLATFRPRSR